MSSQRNSGRQSDKQHGITMIATAALAARRFAAYDGGYPTAAGGAKDAQGVTETAAAIGEAVTVVTGYSSLVETGGAVAFGDLVKPDTTGRAVKGSRAEHCGRALGAATAAGQLIEVENLKHVTPEPSQGG